MLLISLILLVTVCEGNSIFKSDIKIFDYLSEYDYTNNQPDLTCFTCDKSQSNEACNTKAIDEPCNHSHRGSEKKFHSCLTVHQFNSNTLETISIEKKCIQECTSEMVGCETSIFMSSTKKHQHVRTCSYCCSRNYCNLESVINVEQAFNRSDIVSFSNNACLNFFHFSFVIIILLGLKAVY